MPAPASLSLSTVLLSTLAPPPHTRPTLVPPPATSHCRRISRPRRLLPAMPVPCELEPPHRASASSLPHHMSSHWASSVGPLQQRPTANLHGCSATARAGPPLPGWRVSTSMPAQPLPSPVLLRPDPTIAPTRPRVPHVGELDAGGLSPAPPRHSSTPCRCNGLKS
jgi:hypothetical protein